MADKAVENICEKEAKLISSLLLLALNIDEKEKKKRLAQFYTTKYHYIFQGLKIPKAVSVVEPFVGTGLLKDWAIENGASLVETYDVDPKIQCTEIRNTLCNPPDYKGKYIVTNPPFLARNKTKDKTLFDLYETNDLYKCFIKTVVDGNAMGGVVITPLNFFCDERVTEARDLFLTNYSVEKLNIFEETVFDDTTYTVCSFQFKRSSQSLSNQKIQTTIFPHQNEIVLDVCKEHDWKVAGHLFEKVKSDYKVGRLAWRETKNDRGSKFHSVTKDEWDRASKIYLYGIDGGTEANRIRLSLREKPFCGIPTDRVFATLTITPSISEDKQSKIVSTFNKELEELRTKYNSLFLTNFRNSTKAYARKRIGFDMVYNMVKKIINDIDKSA